MKNLYFDEQQHPEMLSVALKGDYLREFTTLARENLALTLSANFSETTPQQEAILAFLRRLQNKVISEIMAGLDSPAAHKYGLDLNDLKKLVCDKAEIETSQTGLETTARALATSMQETDVNSTAVSKEVRNHVAADCLKGLMYMASACLALQEHKEKDFIDMILKAQKENFTSFANNTIQPNLPITDPETRSIFSIQAAAPMISSLALYHQHNERRSPFVKMEKAILFGKDFSSKEGVVAEVRKIVAAINGYDLNNYVDQEKFRRAEQVILKYTSKMMGIAMPSAPELA